MSDSESMRTSTPSQPPTEEEVLEAIRALRKKMEEDGAHTKFHDGDMPDATCKFCGQTLGSRSELLSHLHSYRAYLTPCEMDLSNLQCCYCDDPYAWMQPWVETSPNGERIMGEGADPGRELYKHHIMAHKFCFRADFMEKYAKSEVTQRHELSLAVHN